ncbi:MAG: hypothetical protein DRQ55_00820 [Planctomycetota bacterium]|nr:MAG: hypothetical protein DRQ55_00820 [Planctomycetota bacterium]
MLTSALSPHPRPPPEALVESLLDAGTLVRWLHLVSAAAFVGLAAALDWVLGPALLGPRGRGLLGRVGPMLMLALRWTGATAWVTGMVYGLGWLARQDPAGPLSWLSSNQRGQWIALAAGLASVAVFLSWFLVSPCWEQLAAASAADAQGASQRAGPDPRRWRQGAALGARLTSALSLPLLFAMGAARHLGETGADPPASFGPAATLVVVGGLAAGLVLGSAANALARRSLDAGPG